MTLREVFGGNLRHYRKAKHMTQSDLADAADLSREMIGRIERGIVAPSFESIEVLARVLEVSEATFFGSGVLAAPAGERGRLLQRINTQLSKLNESDLARVSKMLEAF